MDEEEKKLVEEYLRNTGATQCAPVQAKGGDISPWAHDLVVEKRKEFRKNEREKKKGYENK